MCFWLWRMPLLNVYTAIHDAFELYGRPKAYTWDPRDPTSMMFAYPIGPGRDVGACCCLSLQFANISNDSSFSLIARLQSLWIHVTIAPLSFVLVSSTSSTSVCDSLIRMRLGRPPYRPFLWVLRQHLHPISSNGNHKT